MVVLQHIDYTHLRALSGLAEIMPCLTVKAEFWRMGRYKRERHEYDKPIISKKLGIIFSGHLERIRKYCEKMGIQIEVQSEGPRRPMLPSGYPTLPGKLWKHQEDLLAAARAKQCGVIISPTGSGKTTTMANILSCFSGRRAIIFVHSLDLQTQTIEALRGLGLNGVYGLGGSYGKDISPEALVLVATRQSTVKVLADPWFSRLDIVFVDEVHLFGGLEGELSEIIQHFRPPICLGFTATLPPSETEKGAVIEGLVGPVIGEIPLEETTSAGINAVPHMIFVSSPHQKGAPESWSDCVERLIVASRSRNRAILEQAAKMNRDNKTVLIFVERIEHGRELERLAALLEIPLVFTCGQTEQEERVLQIQALRDRHAKCVVATRIWTAGVDIPSLDAIILASADKGSIMTMQKIGRALRVSDGKNDAYIVDIIDTEHYLAEHLAFRMQMYKELGWV